MYKKVTTMEVYENGKLVSRDRKVETDMPKLESEIAVKENTLTDNKCATCDIPCDDGCDIWGACCKEQGEDAVKTVRMRAEDIEDDFECEPDCGDCDCDICPYNEPCDEPDEWREVDIPTYLALPIIILDKVVPALIGAGIALLLHKKIK